MGDEEAGEPGLREGLAEPLHQPLGSPKLSPRGDFVAEYAGAGVEGWVRLVPLTSLCPSLVPPPPEPRRRTAAFDSVGSRSHRWSIPTCWSKHSLETQTSWLKAKTCLRLKLAQTNRSAVANHSESDASQHRLSKTPGSLVSAGLGTESKLDGRVGTTSQETQARAYSQRMRGQKYGANPF